MEVFEKMRTKKAFVVRMSRQSQEALRQGVIAVGWSKAADLNSSMSWNQLKTAIKQKYPRYENSGQALGNASGSVWRFIKTTHPTENVMDIGDWVLLPGAGGTGTFYIGVVTSNAVHVNGDWAVTHDLQWQREVQWLTSADKPIQRDAASERLQRRMKARQTCVDATDLIRDIEDVEQNRNRVTFDNQIRKQAKLAVADALKAAVNSDQLEELIKRLCLVSGACKVVIPPKNSRLDGDADVVADYPVSVAGDRKIVQVIYQIKRHEGTTPKGGVLQIKERMMEMDKNNDVNVLMRTGCLVTTADQVSLGASEEAANVEDIEEAIKIVVKEDLINWILDSGIRNLDF